jgi:hypothetical protein
MAKAASARTTRVYPRPCSRSTTGAARSTWAQLCGDCAGTPPAATQALPNVIGASAGSVWNRLWWVVGRLVGDSPHNPKVAGSNPAPATTSARTAAWSSRRLFSLACPRISARRSCRVEGRGRAVNSPSRCLEDLRLGLGRPQEIVSRRADQWRALREMEGTRALSETSSGQRREQQTSLGIRRDLRTSCFPSRRRLLRLLRCRVAGNRLHGPKGPVIGASIIPVWRHAPTIRPIPGQESNQPRRRGFRR